MQNPQNSSPSTGQKNPSALPFLQDSSLFTHLPSVEPGQLVQLPDSKADQKLLAPPKPSLAQLDSQGGIRINITIRSRAWFAVWPWRCENRCLPRSCGMTEHSPCADKPVSLNLN